MAHINIKQIIKWGEGDGLELVRKLGELGVLAKEGDLTCSVGHTLKLAPNSNSSDGFLWRCREVFFNSHRKRCRCDFSISLRKNTFFSKSHLSLEKICIFVNLWTQNVTLNVCEVQAEMSHQTAVDWASFCREVVEFSFIHNKEKLGGPGKTVEIDESKFGRRKYYRGHRVEGQWVFGGIERETGRCFLVPVEKRDAATLVSLIKEWIMPGTTIISDFWKAYDVLDNEGFRHLKVNHSINFVDPETGAHTNTIESTWRHAKDSMPSYHRKKSHFVGYLAKYMFLKSCRISKRDPMVEFFRHAVTLYSPRIPEPPVAMLQTPDSDEESSEDVDQPGAFALFN